MMSMRFTLFALMALVVVLCSESRPLDDKDDTDFQPSKGCFFRGKLYPLKSMIHNSENILFNWCYGAYCHDNGQVVIWDKFNCRKVEIVTPTTTPKLIEIITIPEMPSQ